MCYVPKNPPWHQPIQSDRSYTNGTGAAAVAEVLHHVFAVSSDDENRITRLATARYGTNERKKVKPTRGSRSAKMAKHDGTTMY